MRTVVNCCISAAPTFPPQNPSLSLLTSRSINVTWLPPPPEHQNGIIRHYLINVTETETGMSTVHMSNTTWLLLNELHPHYNYVLLFAAVTVETGFIGSRISVQTLEDGNAFIVSKMFWIIFLFFSTYVRSCKVHWIFY